MEPESLLIETDCWAAACTDLATVAPLWGVGPRDVRELCEQATQGAKQDLEAVQLMTASLICGISQSGASREELVQVAHEAFHAHLKLAGEVTCSDLFGA